MILLYSFVSIVPQLHNYRVESSSSLGGVWKYRQAADEISIDDLGDDETDFTDESSLGTPLPDTEMSFFDPLHPVPADSNQDEGAAGVYDDSWLLSALSACAELNKEDQSSSATSQDGDGGRATPQVGSIRAQTNGAVAAAGEDSQNVSANLSEISHSDQASDKGIPDDTCSNYSETSSTWEEFDPLAKSKNSKVEIGKGDLPFNLVDKPPPSLSVGKPEVGKGDLTFGLMGSTTTRLPPDGQDSSLIDSSSEPATQRASPFPEDCNVPGIPNTKPSAAKSSPLRFWSSSPKDSPQHRSATSSMKSSPARSPRKQLMTVDLGERGEELRYKLENGMICPDFLNVDLKYVNQDIMYS